MTGSVIVNLEGSLRRGVLLAVALGTLLGAGGCSSVPDAMNPVEWYRGTRDWIAGDDKVQPAKQAEAKPVPGADKPFPRLDTVPERPAATTDAERQQMARTLIADRESARYTDEQIRRQSDDVATSPSAAPPPPSAPAAAPTRQPAAAPAETRPERARPSSQPTLQELPPEVRSAEPAAGQVAAVPRDPRPRVPSAPPPPEISSIIAAGQPIPVDPAPPQQQQGWAVPAVPPAAVEVAPAGQRTAFVPPHPFSPRFPSGGSAAQGPRTFNAAPPPPLVQQPGFTPATPLRPPAAEAAPPDGPPVATIYFGSGSAKVGPRGRSAIRQAFAAWKSRGGRIRVVGHASSRTRNMDRVSHELANFRVSDDRARAVARELIRLGVDPAAIIIEAVSDHEPAYVEVMPAGEAGNRRAEILLEN